VRLRGIAHTKLYTKFEVCSSSSFGDMLDRMPKIVGSRDLGHAHFQRNYLCARSAFQIQIKDKVIHFGTNDFSYTTSYRLSTVTFAL